MSLLQCPKHGERARVGVCLRCLRANRAHLEKVEAENKRIHHQLGCQFAANNKKTERIAILKTKIAAKDDALKKIEKMDTGDIACFPREVRKIVKEAIAATGEEKNMKDENSKVILLEQRIIDLEQANADWRKCWTDLLKLVPEPEALDKDATILALREGLQKAYEDMSTVQVITMAQIIPALKVLDKTAEASKKVKIKIQAEGLEMLLDSVPEGCKLIGVNLIRERARVWNSRARG